MADLNAKQPQRSSCISEAFAAEVQLHARRDRLRAMFHSLKSQIHAECSRAITTKEPLDVTVFVVPYSKLLQISGLTEYASSNLDRLNYDVFSNLFS